MTKYVRVDNVIYEEDEAGRQVFHESPSISKARKWVKEHRAKGLDIRVEEAPRKSLSELQREELRTLVANSQVDARRARQEKLTPDKNSSSYSPERTARRNKQRNSSSGRRGTGSA